MIAWVLESVELINLMALSATNRFWRNFIGDCSHDVLIWKPKLQSYFNTTIQTQLSLPKTADFTFKKHFIRRYLLTKLRLFAVTEKISLGPFTSRYCHTGTTVDNSIYLIGGQIAFSERFGDTFQLNTDTGELKRLLEMPPMSKHTATLMKDQKIWIFGGFDGKNGEYELSLFDISRKSWTTPEVKGNKPASRSLHAAASVGDQLYIFGGLVGIGEQTKESNDFFVLNTKTMEWKEVKPVNPVSERPCARSGVLFFPLGDRYLMLFSGGNECKKKNSKNRNYSKIEIM